MKKNAILYILLLFLVLVNGFFLFNYLGRPVFNGPKGQKGPGDFIVKALRFDDAQMDKMKVFGREHHQKIRVFNDDLRMLKDTLFAKISQEPLNTHTIDSITNEIGVLESKKEIATFFYLKNIQSICNERQKERFKNIVNDALHKNAPQGPNPPPPPPPRN